MILFKSNELSVDEHNIVNGLAIHLQSHYTVINFLDHTLVERSNSQVVSMENQIIKYLGIDDEVYKLEHPNPTLIKINNRVCFCFKNGFKVYLYHHSNSYPAFYKKVYSSLDMLITYSIL